MSTHCYIGIKNTNGTVRTIYCHNDGYPSHIMETLTKYYNTEQKVKDLIALGDISCLYDNIAPTTNTHTFDTPEFNVTIAYHRDRNENWSNCAPVAYASINEALTDTSDASYIYIYDVKTNTWKDLSDRYMLKIKNIEWDSDNEASETLPSKVEISASDINSDNKIHDELINDITEWLSNKYEFCPMNFTVEISKI